MMRNTLLSTTATLWLLALLPSAFGFAVLPQQPGTVRSMSSLAYAQDASRTTSTNTNLVQTALDATQEYGPVSTQALDLWKAVLEQMQTSSPFDNTDDDTFMEECLLAEDGSPLNMACLDYHDKMSQLMAWMHEHEDWRMVVAHPERLQELQTLTRELEDIKRLVNDAPSPPVVQMALRQALEQAVMVTEREGRHDADLWKNVAHVAQQSILILSPLDEECLVEQASDACRALEAFSTQQQQEENSSS
mmetsp:Transcript_15245/g.31442  ORF Transcript_15245/g.31442 Transcript_15245/m.31442 type:complete len:248 (-) Transcript_15245:245-988(-)